ncbi:hypothetical protein BJ742DRAFT_733807 [Cladochytrium replicatum]|nr:hypothetical protein BJ742DRAFT_733807 [Cladochytrium replicatum]
MSRLRDRRRNKQLDDLSEEEDGGSIAPAEEDNNDGTSSSYETSGEENESDDEEEEETRAKKERNEIDSRKHAGAQVSRVDFDEDEAKHQEERDLGDDDWGELPQNEADHMRSITGLNEQNLGDVRGRGERRKKDFDEYKRKLREDPAFTPNMGHFWLHDDRFGGGGPAGRGAGRGRDTDFGFGRGRGSPSSGRGRGAPTKRTSFYGSGSDFRRREAWDNDSDGGDKWVHDKFEELEKHDKPMDRRRSWGPRDLREVTTKGSFRGPEQQSMMEKKKSAPNLKLPVTTSLTSESPETSPKRTILNGTKQRTGNLIPLSSRGPPNSFGRERSGSLKSMDSTVEDYRDDSDFRGESSTSPWMGSRNPSAGFVTDRAFSPSLNSSGRGVPRKSLSSTRHFSRDDNRTNEQNNSQSYSEKVESPQFRNRSEEHEGAGTNAQRSKRYLGVKSSSHHAQAELHHVEESNSSEYKQQTLADSWIRNPSFSSVDEHSNIRHDGSSDNVLKNAINAPEFRPSSVPLESSQNEDGFNDYRQSNIPFPQNRHRQAGFASNSTQSQTQTVSAYATQPRVALTAPTPGQPMFTSTGQMFFVTENGLMVPADQYVIPYAPYPAIYMQQAMVTAIGADGSSLPAFPYYAQPTTASVSPGMYIPPTPGASAAFTGTDQTQHGFYAPSSLALTAQGRIDAPAGIVISATNASVSGGTLTPTPVGANGSAAPASSLSSYNKARLSPVSTKGSPTGASPTSMHSQGSGSGPNVLGKRGNSAVQIRYPSTLDGAYNGGDVGIHYDDEGTPTGGLAKAAPTRGNPHFAGYDQHYSSAAYRSGYTHYGQYRNPDAEPALLDDDLWVTDGVPDLDKIGGHDWEFIEKKDNGQEEQVVEDEEDEEEEDSDDDVEVVIDFANAKPPRLALAQMMVS